MPYDGIDSEIGRNFETCLDRGARLNVMDGCVTYVDFGTLRSGKKRPAVGNGDRERRRAAFWGCRALLVPSASRSSLAGA